MYLPAKLNRYRLSSDGDVYSIDDMKPTTSMCWVNIYRTILGVHKNENVILVSSFLQTPLSQYLVSPVCFSRLSLPTTCTADEHCDAIENNNLENTAHHFVYTLSTISETELLFKQHQHLPAHLSLSFSLLTVKWCSSALDRSSWVRGIAGRLWRDNKRTKLVGTY